MASSQDASGRQKYSRGGSVLWLPSVYRRPVGTKARLLNARPIPTESSRPKRSPRALSKEVVRKIIENRLERNRCGQVVHQSLIQAGVSVSLSSVQRTLDRCHLTKTRSPWKRPHDFTPRPERRFLELFLRSIRYTSCIP